MEFRVLGPVEVRHGDRVEVLSGRLQRTLLGVLLERADQPVPADVLTQALWGDRPDPRAAQRLQLHVHRLRGVLDSPDRLTFGSNGYRLHAHADEVDAERFEALVKAGTATTHDPQRAIESLRSALALYRGTPFADLETTALADWARRLAERRLAAVESLHAAESTCGVHQVGELTELVREHPWRERLHVLLMTALYRTGRRTEALDAYRRARHALVSELGLEPGPELRDLHHRILADDLPTIPRPSRHVPAQLPVDVPGFVGREAELAELDGVLSANGSASIAAVTGTPGVGKTALAVRWAHRVRDRFPDGQLHADLRGHGPDGPVSAADVLAAFLRSSGLTAIPDRLDERAALFRTLLDRRRMLIVLDNARSVDQVRPLLPGGSSCLVLVTSRDSLAGLVARHGAHRIRLDLLPSADAVGLLRDLLGDRADIEPEAVATLVERCARLPLALRVVSELIQSRPGRALADLATELADQRYALDLLRANDDPRTSVRTVFSWSYQQLDPAAAEVFRLFGVHQGQALDIPAVAATADLEPRRARHLLDALVCAHLVNQDLDGRYQPHSLLRAYATELAATTDSPANRAAALSRLAAHHLATASAAMQVIAPDAPERRPQVAAPGTGSPAFDGYDAAFRRLDRERTNLLAARAVP
ncbi:DNA-binding SARP family transcriptional activator [Saccharothrix saharensis]|uniref:DNA-binding SARP family transcriptional activator n=2 Tax=Saccharothrix saharensis TaxID=571190 RepID=A0A543JDI7_9PSEU|nr:DNA-binding SARP family transcriptional activator [Saccharothrix saharensis]